MEGNRHLHRLGKEASERGSAGYNAVYAARYVWNSAKHVMMPLSCMLSMLGSGSAADPALRWSGMHVN